jgi:hypothetical protein
MPGDLKLNDCISRVSAAINWPTGVHSMAGYRSETESLISRGPDENSSKFANSRKLG